MAENENIKAAEAAAEENEKEQDPVQETPETEEMTAEEAEETVEETEAEEPAEETDPEEDAAGQKAGKGWFGRKKDKEKEAMKEKIASLEDRVRRQMAEFDNYRKRTDKEKETMFSMGERSVIEKLLPTVDNFERGLAALTEEEKQTPFADGMDKIYRQLIKQLEDLGVKPIEAVGQEFNPDYHNAVMQVESEEFEEGIVAQEFQKGYLYHDSVLRHSMVAVAK